jgi:hypothetical protein
MKTEKKNLANRAPNNEDDSKGKHSHSICRALLAALARCTIQFIVPRNGMLSGRFWLRSSSITRIQLSSRGPAEFVLAIRRISSAEINPAAHGWSDGLKSSSLALNNNSRVRFGGENLLFYHLNSFVVISRKCFLRRLRRQGRRKQVRPSLIGLPRRARQALDLLSRGRTARSFLRDINKAKKKKFCSGEVKVGGRKKNVFVS